MPKFSFCYTLPVQQNIQHYTFAWLKFLLPTFLKSEIFKTKITAEEGDTDWLFEETNKLKKGLAETWLIILGFHDLTNFFSQASPAKSEFISKIY